MDSIGIPWNSDGNVGIHRNPLELMGECKDLHQHSIMVFGSRHGCEIDKTLLWIE